MDLGSMMDEFTNDYMDGKVNVENYPHAFKVLDALNETSTRLVSTMESGNTMEALSALNKTTKYALDCQEAYLNDDFDAVNLAIKTFTGVDVDITSAREELKGYLKSKIDEL